MSGPFLASIFFVAAASFAVSPGIDGLLGFALGWCALAICVIDLKTFTIPNELCLFGFALAVFHNIVLDGVGWEPSGQMLLRSFMTSAAFFILMMTYEWIRKHPGLGLGDVKLALVAGAWLQWFTIILAVEMASLAALVTYIVYIRWKGTNPDRYDAIPFGAFLAPAIWIGWVYEAVLMNYI